MFKIKGEVKSYSKCSGLNPRIIGVVKVVLSDSALKQKEIAKKLIYSVNQLAA